MNPATKRPRRRAYRQTARAAAAEMTAQRIAEAFSSCIINRWFDEVTLEEVAERAGVSVRTVLRKYGDKEGLTAGFVKYVVPQIAARRTGRPGDVEGAIDLLIAFYEDVGDGLIRNLAQEPRQPALRGVLDAARSGHREITAHTFAQWLEPLPGKERQRLLDALVVATGGYTWQVLRRETGRSAKETRAVMISLVRAILDRSARRDD